MKLLPALLLAASTSALPCAAAVINWDGDSTIGSSWFAGSIGDTNWAGDVFPATGDDVVIDAPLTGGSWVSSLLVAGVLSSVTVGDIYVEPDLSLLTVSNVSGMNVNNGVTAPGSAGHRGEISLTNTDAVWGFLDAGTAAASIGFVDVTDFSDLTVNAATSLGRNGGDGTLKVTDSIYRPHSVFVGDGAGSNGTLFMENTDLIVSDRFEVGEYGNGSLPITGGSITAVNMLFGVFAGSYGSGSIYGTSAALSGQLRVGLAGEADVTIGDNSSFVVTTPAGPASITVGEAVSSTAARLRIEASGETATSVTTSQHAAIGINSANALLEIVNSTLTTAKGASTTGSSCILGLNAGSVGSGMLENGSLIGDGATVVGFNGSGSLTLDGGQVDCNNLQVARMAASTGNVTVYNSGTITLDTSAIIGGGPDGAGGIATVNINSGGQLHASTAIILHAGGELDVVDIIDTPGFAVTGATAFPAPVAGAVNVRTGGTLSGNGKIIGNLDARGGLVSPGLSAGRLWATGNGDMTTGSTLRVEIGGVIPIVQHDVLKLDGTFNYIGLTIEVLTPSFTPSGGQSFKIIDAAAYAGTSFVFSGPSLPSGLSWDTSTLATDGTLRISGTVSGQVRIVSTTRSGNDIILGVIGDSGTPYIIQAGTTLAPGSWNDLPGSFNANGALQNHVISNTFVDFPGRRFFRLKRE